MMAPDSHAGRPELSQDSIAKLTSALETYLADRQTEALRASLQGIAVEAREKRIHAEQLLIALKDAWYALPSLTDRASDQQNRLLQDVVALCIREYYST